MVGLCRMPCWRGGGEPESVEELSGLSRRSGRSQVGQADGGPNVRQNRTARASASALVRSLLPTRRRLQLDPSAKLYFPWQPIARGSHRGEVHIRSLTHNLLGDAVSGIKPESSRSQSGNFIVGATSPSCFSQKMQYDEPGKQVRSAVRIKNTSKSLVAFKFQTTAPKSCFMRPPGGILSPGESIIATVFKFVEHPENNEKPQDLKNKVKFKIMSLKVTGSMEYVPELFDEQKDHVAVERILSVVFLDVERPSPKLDKLKRQLSEAEAALEARKKPPEDTGPRIVGEGLVIDEWKERRERYLARQQVDAVDSA